MIRTHVAIMRRAWGLTDKILTGEKTIESRWYKNRACPWGKIAVGDEIYFKDSGGPVRLRARVREVRQFDGLTSDKVHELLNQYGRADGLGTMSADYEPYYQRFRAKNYCLLIFLEAVEKVVPFAIDKKGFGSQAAWLVVDDIERIKKR